MKKLFIGLALIVILAGLIFGYFFTRQSRQSSADVFTAGIWQQTEFSGGASSEANAITWGQADGWNKYGSASNITFTGPNSFVINGNTAEIASSIFYTSDNTSMYQLTMYTGESPFISYNNYYRVGSSLENMTDWIDLTAVSGKCQSDLRYFQVKYVYNNKMGTTIQLLGLKAFQGYFTSSGVIYDNSSNNPLNGATVAIGSYSTTSKDATGKGGGGAVQSGYYSIRLPFNESNKSYTINASKDGYQNKTETVSLSCVKLFESVKKDIYLVPNTPVNNDENNSESNVDSGSENTTSNATSENVPSDEAANEDQDESAEPTVSEEAAAPTKPSAPVVNYINSFQMPNNNTMKEFFDIDEPLVISGKTAANATVKLYIYSDPLTAEVKSDQNGDWKYTLASGLKAGEHRVEAEVTDANGNKSDKTEIAKFTVKEKQPIFREPKPEKTTIFNSTFYILGAVLLVLIGGLNYCRDQA